MTAPPPHPPNQKLYHITHLRNLPQIAAAGVLWSDAKRIELGLNCDVVGMSHIKRRRLEQIEVSCHAGTHVGDYVPFYFCPRSIMLYILHTGNHPDLNYKEGQGPIVHLEFDLHAAATWAGQNQRRWAFSKRNAGTLYAEFYDSFEQFNEVNWAAVQSNNFQNATIKEGKQAEFLIEDSVCWPLVERIGVLDTGVAARVAEAINGAAHQPAVVVEKSWYY